MDLTSTLILLGVIGVIACLIYLQLKKPAAPASTDSAIFEHNSPPLSDHEK
jgi:hypothetical protein